MYQVYSRAKNHRNYLSEPAFWVWHRVKENDPAKTIAPTTKANLPAPAAPSSEATSTTPKKDAVPKQNQPQPKTTNQKKQTALAPSLKFIISIMPGNHIFVGHRHNNKYHHHTLSSLQDHLKKTKPKHVTVAVDVKANMAFVQRVIETCKELGVQSYDVLKTSDIPTAIPQSKETPSKQPVDKK